MPHTLTLQSFESEVSVPEIAATEGGPPSFRGVFIRAPGILEVGLEVLANVQVQSDRIAISDSVESSESTADDVIDCSHGKQLYELCQEKYEPWWIKGGNHCYLELYPEYIKHLQKFAHTVEKPSTMHTSRKSVNRPEHSRKSTDYIEAPRKNTDRKDKPRRSTDRSEKLKNNKYKYHKDDRLSKLKPSFDDMERSRRSVECYEKPRTSINIHLEKARKSVDWLDTI